MLKRDSRTLSLWADEFCLSPLTRSAAQTVPVARAADNAKTGKGTLYIESSPSDSSADDPVILKGSGSSFTTELGAKYQVQLGKQYNFATVEVVQVVDDETVKIKKMFNKDKIVHDLVEAGQNIKKGGKGLAYKCLPYIDQTRVSTISKYSTR